jgi:hypothetical protein
VGALVSCRFSVVLEDWSVGGLVLEYFSIFFRSPVRLAQATVIEGPLALGIAPLAEVGLAAPKGLKNLAQGKS